MSALQGSYAKLVIIGSAVVYLSAGVALYYFYKKYPDRRNRPKTRRRSRQSSSLSRKSGQSDSEYCYCKHCSDEERSDASNDDDAATKTQAKHEKELERNFKDVARSDDHLFSVARCNSLVGAGPSAFKIDEVQTQIEHLSLPSVEDVTNEQWKPTCVELISPENENQNDSVDTFAQENPESCCNVDNHSQSCDTEVSNAMMRRVIEREQDNLESYATHLIHGKNECANSPSISSDSESSQDSGKGASMGLTTSTSPVNDIGIELPPMYEFEVPQDIVGLIIGRKGTTIKYFTEESGAHIVIRHHHFSDKHKICTIEGTREQINKCLRLIRYKFPPSRFPDLKLTPLLPPPIVSPHSPVFDSIINLNLPEGVSCEVSLSSLVDTGHFFVQQPTHPTFPSLARLDQYLLAVYSQPAGVPGLPRPIDSGIICVAPVLGGWYRAQTVATFAETDEVLVRFVDYGGYSKLSAADLRQIRSDFMNLPFQAMECSLASVKPISESDGWSAEANAFFEKCVHGKLAEAVLVAKDKDTLASIVQLYCLVDGKVEMVNELLVSNGFAVWDESDRERSADSESSS